MSKIICNKEDIVAVADRIRSLSGKYDTMTFEEMQSRLNLVEIPRIIIVNFPKSSIGATIYYSGENGKLKTATLETGASLKVMENTIIYANVDIFDGTFIFPDDSLSFTKISNEAFVAHKSFTFTYDDGAPV